ncbi:MAG: hypothetical protein PWQ10_628 [Patescibacteria group bacterium]|nr:hypothetical protein [Patescibacteria group bacterium]
MNQKNKVRVALVVPHIFLHRDILPNVIFSPGVLALELANNLSNDEIDVTLFSPGPIDVNIPNINVDMSYFETELAARNDTYLDLLKKHPFVFVSLARQVQSELIAKAYTAANNDNFDIVHIYTNEEDIALPFAKLCNKPVVFTHHDPFNFLIKYKNNFPKYKDLNWISLSLAQRLGMPSDTNWVSNIYHGLNKKDYKIISKPKNDYIAYLGRIIEPKGVKLAIDAVKRYNQTAKNPLKLKIAGKHYADESKDNYWKTQIENELSETIEYVGFIKNKEEKNKFLGNAKALIIPSLFEEPFGMVMIESLACGTPIIGLNSGAIPEIINNKNGILVKKSESKELVIEGLNKAIKDINKINRLDCRKDFENRFTLEQMCRNYASTYKQLAKN